MAFGLLLSGGRTLQPSLAPGDRALFKVYPITTAGRERGSKVVEITWPAG